MTTGSVRIADNAAITSAAHTFDTQALANASVYCAAIGANQLGDLTPGGGKGLGPASVNVRHVEIWGRLDHGDLHLCSLR